MTYFAKIEDYEDEQIDQFLDNNPKWSLYIDYDEDITRLSENEDPYRWGEFYEESGFGVVVDPFKKWFLKEHGNEILDPKGSYPDEFYETDDFEEMLNSGKLTIKKYLKGFGDFDGAQIPEFYFNCGTYIPPTDFPDISNWVFLKFDGTEDELLIQELKDKLPNKDIVQIPDNAENVPLEILLALKILTNKKGRLAFNPDWRA